MQLNTLCFLVTAILALTTTTALAQPKGTFPDQEFQHLRTPQGQCLIDHAKSGTLDALITMPQAMATMDKKTKPETQYIKEYIPVGFQIASYSWEGQRTKELSVMGQTYTVKVADEVGVGAVRTMDPAAFANTYRTPTEAEKEYLRQKMGSALDTSTTAATNVHKDAGSPLTGSLLDGVTFDNVDGIGDAAAWDHLGSALIVLTGDVIFSIRMDAEFDWKSNQKRAVEVAAVVLAACK